MERVTPRGTEAERVALVRLSERVFDMASIVALGHGPTRGECDRMDALELSVGASWDVACHCWRELDPADYPCGSCRGTGEVPKGYGKRITCPACCGSGSRLVREGGAS